MLEKVVSIIIPVYKVPEKYLRKCIESAMNQTLKEIEIILVDDGSPDNCGEICNEYASKDSRVIVIHKENGGLAAARNTGFEKASGKWITFVDGDDWVEATMCEQLKESKIQDDIEIIIFGAIRDYASHSVPFSYNKYADGKIYSGKECKNLQVDILDFNCNIATAYAKFFKRSFLEQNNILHNEELRQGAEGIDFNIRAFGKTQKVLFSKKYLYHYTYNENSISSSHNEKNHYMVLNCFREIKSNIEKSENKDELLKMFYKRLVYVIITTAISGYFSPTNKESHSIKVKKYKEYLNDELVKETLEKTSLKELNIQRKIVLILIKLKFFRCVEILATIRKKSKNK